MCVFVRFARFVDEKMKDRIMYRNAKEYIEMLLNKLMMKTDE